jgi:hypothetical protein
LVTLADICAVWVGGINVPGVTVGTVFVGGISPGVLVVIAFCACGSEADESTLVSILQGRIPSSVLVVTEEGGE